WARHQARSPAPGSYSAPKRAPSYIRKSPKPPPDMMSPIRLAFGVSAAALFALPLAAQNVTQQDQYDPKAILAAEHYQKPPALVERIVAANRNANVTLGNPSPDRKWFIKLDSDGLPSLEDFAKGHIYLGGLQVDTMAFRSRALTTRGGNSITLIDATTGKARTLETLAGADISS